MLKRCGILLALVLALAACETRAEITVNSDGSGTFGFVFGMASTYASAGMGDIVELLREDLARGPVAWNFENVNEPGLKGFRATVPFTDMDDLREKMKVLAEAEEGGFTGRQDNLGQDFQIQRVGGGWTVRAQGSTPELDEVNPFIDESTKKLLNQMFRFEFHVSLPGYPSDSNADEVKRSGSRTTFIWRSSSFSSEKVMIRAHTTDTAPASFPVVPLGVGVIGALGVALFLRRKPRSGGVPPVVLEGLPDARVPASVGAPSEGAGQSAE